MLEARLSRWSTNTENHYVTNRHSWASAAARFRPVAESDVESIVNGTDLDAAFLWTHSYATTWFPEFQRPGFAAYASVPSYVAARCVLLRAAALAEACVRRAQSRLTVRGCAALGPWCGLPFTERCPRMFHNSRYVGPSPWSLTTDGFLGSWLTYPSVLVTAVCPGSACGLCVLTRTTPAFGALWPQRRWSSSMIIPPKCHCTTIGWR